MSSRQSEITLTDLTTDSEPRTVRCADVEITEGMVLQVDGYKGRKTKYTVEVVAETGFGLIGPRGGEKWVTRNIHHGTLYMMGLSSMANDTRPLKGITIVSK